MLHIEPLLYVASLLLSGILGWFTAVIMMAPSMAERNRKNLEKEKNED